jgi:hypothetical protein
MGGRGNPETNRARIRRYKARMRRKPAWRRKKQKENLTYFRRFQANNGNKFKRWLASEDSAITATNKPPDSLLSKRLGRSVQAIQMRRYLIRKAAQ